MGQGGAEKQRIWQEKLNRVELLTDKLGLRVDEGIKETVAAFHLFGINTIASHEGKINRYPIPYVDVESPDVQEFERKLDNIEGGAKESEQAEDSLRKEIIHRNLKERKKIIPLLEEFYAERKVPYVVRLGIDSQARGWSRIQSQGADFQEIETDEKVRAKRLHQFQQEMKSFTNFLKDKYFEAEENS